jgi:glycosyltransferase involved in cell wall biosynthesis
MTVRPRVLYVVHADSRTAPGGVQIYGRQLYEAVRADGRFDPFLVTRTEPDPAVERGPGSRFAVAEDDPQEIYLLTRHAEFDPLFWSTRDSSLYTQHWRDLLEQLAPDIVHFRHVYKLGYDLIRETRHSLPDTPLIYHLADFNPICHHDGQMVRTGDHALCDHATPRRCHGCFPTVSEQSFFLRERNSRSALDLIDVFIAPSRFVGQRFSEWGIPAERIVYEDHGCAPAPRLPDPPDAGRRRRIGFFGQITPYKGLDVLLEAMRILAGEGAGVDLQVHGRLLDTSVADFRERISDLMADTVDVASFPGPYAHADLPQLMSAVDWVVVPSIWWEIGPNVIREAWLHGRPVICSDIGSMAERVHPGVDGLHFRTGDPVSLAASIRRAVDDGDLWRALRDGITPPREMDEYVATISALYERLLAPAAAPEA